MSAGTESKPVRGKDPAVRMAMMVLRGGFVIALLLGLAMAFGLLDGGVVIVHMGVGFITVAAALAVAVRLSLLGRSGAGLVWAAVILMVLAAMLMLLEMLPGLAHLALMVVAVGLGEMAAARAARSG